MTQLLFNKIQVLRYDLKVVHNTANVNEIKYFNNVINTNKM